MKCPTCGRACELGGMDIVDRGQVIETILDSFRNGYMSEKLIQRIKELPAYTYYVQQLGAYWELHHENGE